ncbi:hypothetical protein BGL78_03205 [Helicobacter pylori]|nr:hypothetical protein BGL78_03205 [Helicobacter pylori]
MLFKNYRLTNAKFPTNQYKNAKKDFFIKPPKKKQRVQNKESLNKGFKKRGFKKKSPQKKRELKKKRVKKKES